ncbi:MAG: serine/threonine protein kinase [Planctomycetota bacterium]|nr:MAG: serine/threonine protein kinase [Planctomycetota bacterium]
MNHRPPSDRPQLRFIPTPYTFRLGEPIGMGTMGCVYRASSDDLPGPVAVKILHPAFADDARMVDRFQREIVIMERLSHPHIVRHYGGGMMEGQYFYAMELLDRGSLKDRLQRGGPLEWPLAALYTAQIAAALQHAHNHGVVHRDLKPTNLFFADDGRLLLGDFGIARDLQTGGADPGARMGTYAYMSPEQIRAERELTGSSDLYSLGCVAYEMLSGKPPFLGENFAQIWDQHLRATPRGLAEQGVACPDWFEKLVLRLLAKDPHQRPFNARAVQGYLRDHLEDRFGPDYARIIATQFAKF